MPVSARLGVKDPGFLCGLLPLRFGHGGPWRLKRRPKK
jgi:hypothetical protein